MDKNWSDIGQVSVRTYNGSARVYENLNDAVRAVGYDYIAALRGDRLAYGDDPRNPVYYRAIGGDTHIFFDQYGIRIPVWKVQETWNNLPTVWISQLPWNRGKYDPKTFRKGPVPGIHSRRWRFSSYHRYPKTLQEHRWAEALRDDREEVREYTNRSLRARNRDNSLPVAWDDVPRSTGWNNKSWKSYRKHQYK